MTRTELIEALAHSHPELKADTAEVVVHEIIEAMSAALEHDERIELRGFGTFTIHRRKPGHAHNPKTGELVPVGERRFVHFKPGAPLRARVNNQQGS
ncbi:MAG: integration host factor subunit beta [Succinivibrio sp.]|nr:integration host factor subunit beta [Succinivibrio sp.]